MTSLNGKGSQAFDQSKAATEKDILFNVSTLFWFGGILGSASGAKFPVSLSNHVGFMPRLLFSSTHHSPESLTHLKLVKLKMLDYSDRTRTGISILTSAADFHQPLQRLYFCNVPCQNR